MRGSSRPFFRVMRHQPVGQLTSRCFWNIWQSMYLALTLDFDLPTRKWLFSLSHIHDYLDLEDVILVILSVLCDEKIWIIMNLIREDPFDVEVLLTLLVKNFICTQYIYSAYAIGPLRGCGAPCDNLPPGQRNHGDRLVRPLYESPSLCNETLLKCWPKWPLKVVMP